jgi:hypothetical protein
MYFDHTYFVPVSIQLAVFALNLTVSGILLEVTHNLADPQHQAAESHILFEFSLVVAGSDSSA